jgi:hypothetical protein
MNKLNAFRLACAAGIISVLLTACAQPGPVLLQDILYQAPTGTTSVPAKHLAAGVGPFKDLRGKPVSMLGKRTISNGVENDLVVQGTVSDIVTAALKDALTAQGMSPRDTAAWGVETGPGAGGGEGLLFSGEIKTLWVDSQARPLNVQTKATVQLRVAVADAAEGKVLRVLNLSSMLSQEEIAFSFDTVQRTLSEALTGALDQLVKDPVVQERLQ